MKKTPLLILLVIVAIFSSCKKKKIKEAVSIEKVIKEESKTSKVRTEQSNQFLITVDGFMGFKPGNKVDLESKNIKKNIQENGEGSFYGYQLLDDDEKEIGFIFPKHNNNKIINIIEIYSPKYKTKEGIGIGATYQDLKQQYPNMTIHGSEIESSTNCYVGNLSFQLNVFFNTYKIDESKIKPFTKITRISIWHKKN